MLEDSKAALQDLEKVTVLFRLMENECLVPSMTSHIVSHIVTHGVLTEKYIICIYTVLRVMCVILSLSQP